MKLRERPREIEAVQYDGMQGADQGVCTSAAPGHTAGPHVHTVEQCRGVPVSLGDWIVFDPDTDEDGERFYPLPADEAVRRYEVVEG